MVRKKSMTTKNYPLSAEGIKITATEGGAETGRIRIYFIHNDFHPKPYALAEDLFVQEEFRGKGYGTRLLQAAIEEAKKKGCYKIIATSRHPREKVHELYQKLGFKEWGKEFRMDLH
jgi:GNAT superfamily N-acetyltransferase